MTHFVESLSKLLLHLLEPKDLLVDMRVGLFPRSRKSLDLRVESVRRLPEQRSYMCQQAALKPVEWTTNDRSKGGSTHHFVLLQLAFERVDQRLLVLHALE